MTDLQQTIAEQLDIAEDLIGGRRLDIDRTLTMLNALPDDIGDAARSRVEQALQTIAAAAGQEDSRYEAMARFALARVIVMLEQRSLEPRNAELPRLRSDASDRLEDPIVRPRIN